MKGPCVVIICAVFNILHSYETKKITLHWQRAVAEVICHWKIVPKKQKDGSNMAVIKDLKRQSSHHRETSQLTYWKSINWILYDRSFGVSWVNNPSSKLNSALKLEKSCFFSQNMCWRWCNIYFPTIHFQYWGSFWVKIIRSFQIFQL